MKNYYAILLVFLFLGFGASPLHAQLNTGDIMFVGFHHDGGIPDTNCGDGFAFVALVDIPANTTIYFTEDEYNGSAFNTDEGSAIWSHTAVTPAGTVVELTTHSAANQATCGGISASIGTIQLEGNYALSASNEEIYAYLGSLLMPTTWLAALLTDNSDFANTIPNELVGFVLDFTSADQDADLGIYTGSLDCEDRAACLADILNLDNWTTEDGPGDDCCDDDGVDYPGDLPDGFFQCDDIVVTIDISTPISCNGEASGGLTASGGFATYAWSTNENTQSIGGLVAGDYCVTVTDMEGCEGTTCIMLTEPAELSVVTSSTSDDGNSSGTASATVTGGTAPYEYSWSDGSSGSFIFGLGAGNYTVTVTDNNGCEATASVTVEASFTTSLSLNFSTLCLADGPASNLSGGSPAGGVYSGDGVTDDGNGSTFSFTPNASGDVTITYTFGGQSATDVLTVEDGIATFNVSSDGLDLTVSNIMLGLDVESAVIRYGDGTGPVDVGSATELSYTYQSSGGYNVCITTQAPFCQNEFCQTVVIESFLPGDVCSDATSIDSLFNRPQNVAYTSPLFTNVNYTTDDSDPDFGYECFGEPEGNGGAPSLERTRWFTFVGDGNMYYITTVECSATDYIDFGDTQIAIYTGECDALVASACNEDGPDAMDGGPFPAGLEFQTEEGVEYRMMIDGFGPDFEADGEFCIQVTNLSVTSVDDIFGTPYQVFPNPTKGALNITGITPDVVRIQDSYGKLIRTVQNNTNEFSIDDLPNGVYFIQVGLDGSWSTSRIVKTN